MKTLKSFLTDIKESNNKRERNKLHEEDAYDKDRYLVKNGKAVKNNPKYGEKDGPNHVWANDAEEALKLCKKRGLK